MRTVVYGRTLFNEYMLNKASKFHLIKFRTDIFITTRAGEMIHGDIVETRRDSMVINHSVSKFVSSRLCI
jgi:hypothetical protein